MISFDLHKTSSDGRFQLHARADLEEGRFHILSGQSGCGKTTLLRMIAGLSTPDAGHLHAGGRIWYDGSVRQSVPARLRGCGFVFQEAALFPQMTARQNISYAGAGQKVTAWLMDLCGVTGLTERYPATLSGGQKQRVAVARALSHSPSLLLLDEPFSALDPAIRAGMQDMIARVQKETGITVLMVTHDTAEVFRLADQVLVMEQGKILRQGTPTEVFLNRPSSGKFSFYGEVLRLIPAGVMSVAVVAAGGQLAEVVITAEEALRLKPGARVQISAKAFQALIQPAEE